MTLKYIKRHHVIISDLRVIGVIINVAQKVDKPWPLEILDFQRRIHKVFLQPGDVLWFEST